MPRSDAEADVLFACAVVFRCEQDPYRTKHAAPHLGVYFVGMPLRAAAGLAASALAIAMLVPVLEGRAAEAAAVLDRVLTLAAPPP